MKKKVIITGSSGMVGKGVLLECLESEKIENILVVNRNSINMQHPKLKEVLLKDFTKANTIKAELQGYDACFYCMGISALGLSEETYTKITFDTVAAFANVLYELDSTMVFNYVSGQGINEEGSSMWARVKGKTENLVFEKGFKTAFAFRPGIILPEKGIASRTNWYQIFYVILRPLFPLMRRLKNITTTTKLGQAMINTLEAPSGNRIVDNAAINELATG